MQINQSNQTNVNTATDGGSPPTPTPPTTVTPPVMPEIAQLQCSGDMGAMVAALTMQSGVEQRNAARAQRDAAMQAREKADAAEVQDMHDKAHLQRAQGIVDGTLQIAQGATDLGAGAYSAHAANEQAQATSDAADLKENGSSYLDDHKAALKSSVDALNKGAATSQLHATWCKAGGSALGAARSISDGLFSAAMTDNDASAKAHEASAQAFKQMADDAHDTEHDAKALIDKALDFYKEYTDTKNQVAMAAIHRA